MKQPKKLTRNQKILFTSIQKKRVKISGVSQDDLINLKQHGLVIEKDGYVIALNQKELA